MAGMQSVVGGILVCVTLVLSGCTSVPAEPAAAPVATEPPVAILTTPTPEVLPTDQWAIPFAEVEPLGPNGQRVITLRSDGTSLFAMTLPGEDGSSEVLRIDPDTGEIVVRMPVVTPPTDGPFNENLLQVGPFGVVLLDGDRTVARILDPTTLTATNVALPADARNQFADSVDGNVVWALQKQWDFDRGHGIFTQTSVTGIDTQTGQIVTEIDLPGAGATGFAVTETHTIATLESVYQIGIGERGSSSALKVYPSFPIPAVVTMVEGEPWVTWRRIGYTSVLDVATGELNTLDIGADGPPLRTVSTPRYAGGFVWSLASPIDGSLPKLLVRIDPTTVEITARTWIPATTSGLAIIGDMLFFSDMDGGLLTVSATKIVGGHPTETVRPKRPSYDQYEPQTDDETAAIEAFVSVMESSHLSVDVAGAMESGDQLVETRDQLIEIAVAVFGGLVPTVTTFKQDGDSATLVYVFLIDGVPAIFPLTATMNRDETGAWKITSRSFCDLVNQAAISCPEGLD